MRLNKEQQYGYNRYLDYLHLKASEALTLKIEAEEKIRNQKAIEIAKNAIREGSKNEFIFKITGLSVEQVEQLRAEKD
jgi:hypothetical protein